MREIKFRYYQAPGDGDTEWNKQEHTLQDIESGKLDSIMLAQKKYYRIHGPFQFTGLKDKNGKEVWEGDILEHPAVGNNRFKVEWDSIPAAFRAVYPDGISAALFLQLGNGEAVVIGNIYENPELLEK